MCRSIGVCDTICPVNESARQKRVGGLLTSMNRWRVVLYFLALSMFPFLRSCESSAGFPFPAIEGILPLFLKLPSVNISYALLNITIMGMAALAFYGTILTLSKSGIRIVLIYHSVAFLGYIVTNILIFFAPPFIVLYHIYVLLLLPLDPLIRKTIATYINVSHSTDFSMRLSFLLMTIFWYFVGKYRESKHSASSVALSCALVVSLLLTAGVYFASGLINDFSDDKLTVSELFAFSNAKPYKDPEACYNISTKKHKDPGSQRLEMYSLRSECFHMSALETLNSDLCFEIRPVTTVLFVDDTYSVAKCRAAVKEKKALNPVRWSH